MSLSSRRPFDRSPSSGSSLSPCPVDRSPSSRQSNTPSSRAPGPEHRRISQHIRYDEKSYVAPSYVDLIEMADPAVASGDSDVFELDIHVVFS